MGRLAGVDHLVEEVDVDVDVDIAIDIDIAIDCIYRVSQKNVLIEQNYNKN